MTLDPSLKHPDYLDYLPVWQKCGDAIAGQRAIKARGKLYLPELIGHEKESNDAYLERASFFNATGRTVEGYVGMAMRKPLTLKGPEAILGWRDDITLTDESLDDLAADCIRETLRSRPGVLVDMEVSTGPLTAAQAAALQLRPYLTLYKAESIINWERARINGAYRLKNVFLQESYADDDGKLKVQIRQLSMNSGQYEQIVWREAVGKSWVEYSRVTPLKNGGPIMEIPFYPISADKPTIEVGPPPIEDLVDVNIAHYRNSADLENGVHISGLPTAVIIGYQQPDNAGPIALGTSTALVIPDMGATVEFLQVGSEGFSSIEKAMDRKEQHMAALGARMVAPEKKQAETAETASIRRGGENSVLAALVGVVSRQLTKAVTFAADWMGYETKDILVELNKDLVPWNVTFDDLAKAWSLVQQSAFSKDVFGGLLAYAEIVPDDFNYEEDQEKVVEAGPIVLPPSEA
ncbi:DUF4055 domain-containing protein [Hymenobacter sp. HSC-4F20]|uniref:DUF4055 domain-containing protein n=1 Tax=Hymenobacter sp. HSC-4F20 TaxID=2864135 RepID=UPI001C72E146|nr:DUF4055 domain-containing protein [Hymenobacter sp. HSC-4F20]MBX0289713.1 DUF4055 domain-containing protein [Hymenobacter sp. HSC-4F20]